MRAMLFREATFEAARYIVMLQIQIAESGTKDEFA